MIVNRRPYQGLPEFADIEPGKHAGCVVEGQLGDPHALDKNLVSLPAPDSVQALISGQIAAHFTAPPFQFQEQDKSARPIVKSFDQFGRHNLISIWVLQISTTLIKRPRMHSGATSRRLRS